MDFLQSYGYDETWSEQFDRMYGSGELLPARVLAEHKNQVLITVREGELPASLSGRMRFEGGEEPAVGDYVAVRLSPAGDRAVIEGVLQRRTSFRRKDSFNGGMQTLAANIDAALICMSLNRDYKLTRVERYLALARSSGAGIALVLTKADLCPDAETQAEIARALCGDVPVHVVSAVTGEGMPELTGYFAKGKTVAALGSSGVGKSTLVNALFGQEIMKTAEVREDDARGRHTTVHRQMLLLPSGGLYIDTPGLREVGLGEADEAVSGMFEDIEALMASCRFADCRHRSEPGCAVRAAIVSGELEEKRYERYLQLKKEALYHEDRAAYNQQHKAFAMRIAKFSRQQKKKK